MNDRPNNISILSIFHFKNVSTVLHAWLDLKGMIEYTIQKAHDMCGRRWYAMENIMETLHFPTMDLIENACPPKLMIEQIEHQCDEAKEKFQCLDHISIEDIGQLIRQTIYTEGNTMFLSTVGTSSLKTKLKILSVMPN